ncbi:hypothetical protein Y1Q_0009111 [Alligator mississippiensis]|uniref:Uncharacterized protein n=1 Tax=Alligator mississippiensis TaxID=8496 RepID=A0A151M2A9_ALLMI|nr:hypothetical protein Y1Q_0009111 [Alligator mississippiensis]
MGQGAEKSFWQKKQSLIQQHTLPEKKEPDSPLAYRKCIGKGQVNATKLHRIEAKEKKFVLNLQAALYFYTGQKVLLV